MRLLILLIVYNPRALSESWYRVLYAMVLLVYSTSLAASKFGALSECGSCSVSGLEKHRRRQSTKTLG